MVKVSPSLRRLPVPWDKNESSELTQSLSALAAGRAGPSAAAVDTAPSALGQATFFPPWTAVFFLYLRVALAQLYEIFLLKWLIGSCRWIAVNIFVNSFKIFFYLLILETETPVCCSAHSCVHWLTLVCALARDWTLNLDIWGRCSDQRSYPARALGFSFCFVFNS